MGQPSKVAKTSRGSKLADLIKKYPDSHRYELEDELKKRDKISNLRSNVAGTLTHLLRRTVVVISGEKLNERNEKCATYRVADATKTYNDYRGLKFDIVELENEIREVKAAAQYTIDVTVPARENELFMLKQQLKNAQVDKKNTD